MQLFNSSQCITDFFSLHIQPSLNATTINMQMLSSILNTASLPQTYEILQKKLPSIHTSKCFNDKKLPFAKEVTRTEVGHLFEHILLEYIYEIKSALGHKNICVRGETSWDWYKNPTGFFTITINVGVDEQGILLDALPPSIELLQFIFISHINTRLGVKSAPVSGENFTPEAIPNAKLL